MREHRGKRLEVRAALRLFRIEVVDGFNTQEAVVLLALFRWPHLSCDHIAGTQTQAANLRGSYVDIFGPTGIPIPVQA